jgi:nuclear pore complex protein Nup205
VTHSGQDLNSQASPCNNIAILCSFIGLIYSILPSEQALQFWGATPLTETHRLTYLEIGETNAGWLPFLQWGVRSTQTRDVIMTTALYDMLSGLAKGQQCGELAYSFLTRGGVEVIPAGSLATSSSHCSVSSAASWTLVFALLGQFPPPAQSLTHLRNRTWEYRSVASGSLISLRSQAAFQQQQQK